MSPTAHASPEHGSGEPLRSIARALVAFAVYAFPVAGLLGWVGALPDRSVLLTGVGVAAVGALVAWAAVGRAGPRNLLRLVLLGWFIGVVLLAVYGLLELPVEIAFVYAAWVGLVFGGVAVADLRLAQAGAPGRAWTATSAGLVVGIAAWSLVPLLAVDPMWLLLIEGVAALAAWRTLRSLVDPVRPDDPLQRWAPWGDGSGRPARDGWRKLVAAPAVTIYLVVSWALFLPFAEVRNGILQLPFEMTRRYAYHIADLTSDPLSILQSLVTAPFVNHDVVQLVYVSALLVFFGMPFEAREGTKRFLIVFFGVGTVAAIIAGVLLHLIYPDVSTHPVFERAWTRTWSGGSAAAFAIMGGMAARAPVPWPLLGFFVFWELNVGWWFLRSYTPAFHVSALFLGFLLVRYGFPPHERDEDHTTPTSG